MAEFTYIDIGIIAVLFMFMIIGYKKGFIDTILGLVGGLVSLVAAVLLANKVAAMLYPVFGMGQALEGYMSQFLIKLFGASGENDYLLTPIGDPENIAVYVHDAIAKLGLPASFTDTIANAVTTAAASAFAGSELVDKSIVQILSPVMANAAMVIISVIATFIVIRIIVAIIEAIAKAILRTSKSLRGLNGLLGAIAGIAKGALLVVIIFTIGFFVLPGSVEENSTGLKAEIRTTIDNSKIGKFVYEQNPVPKFITDNINFQEIINKVLGVFGTNNAGEPSDNPEE